MGAAHVTASAWRSELQALQPTGWPAYLHERSGLPGPRANTALVAVVAALADDAVVEELLADAGEYTVMCAAAALARRSEDPQAREQARVLATDQRWRVREGVAIGLQLLADQTPAALAPTVLAWADDPDPLVQRAAVAAVCEPRLLRTAAAAALAVEVCRRCTAGLLRVPAHERRDRDVRTLRQALGYCWSVAVAADPEPGLAAFRALDATDPDVAWIRTQNLRKKRLARLL